MGLPGAVNRHHLVPQSLEALHSSAERYIDNIADATDSLLKHAANPTIPDIYLSVTKPSVGMHTVHTDPTTKVTHYYVCLAFGVWTQVV